MRPTKEATRYKMFVNDALRDQVLSSLREQLHTSGAIAANALPRLGLVYGHATAGNEAKLRSHFESRQWLLLGPSWLRQQLTEMACRSYDNQIASVVAKLLLPRAGSDKPLKVAKHGLAKASIAKACMGS